MEAPLIAVLVPTYEPDPAFLHVALTSLLAQTERRWICIIHDDASKRDVRALIEPYLRDPRFSFMRSARRRGIGGNWNACLEHCLGKTHRRNAPLPLGEGTGEGVELMRNDTVRRFSSSGSPLPFDSLRSLRAGSSPPPPRQSLGQALGEGTHDGPLFLQFLFQDDLWYPGYLARASAVLRAEPEVGFVASEHRYVCDEGLETARGYGRLRVTKQKILHPGRQSGGEFLSWWLERGCDPNLIGEPCFVMLRRSLVEAVGPFSETLHQLLDVEYWVRLLRRTNWFYIAEDLGDFRVHAKAASFTHFQEGRALAEHFHFLEHLRRTFPTGSPEREHLAQHLDQHFADIIHHTVNRLIRRRSIGKGGKPVLRYLGSHPAHALRGLVCYASQASGRWIRKGQAAIVSRQSGGVEFPRGNDRFSPVARGPSRLEHSVGGVAASADGARAGSAL